MRALSEQMRAWIGMVCAALIIAGYGPLLRQAQQLFGPSTINGVRFLASTVILMLLLMHGRKLLLLKLSRQHTVMVTLLAVFGFSTGFFLTVAVKQTTLTTSLAILFGVSNLLALPVGRLVFRDKFTVGVLLKGLLALLGIAIYLGIFKGKVEVGLGLAAAIGGGVCDVVANALRKKLGADKVGGIPAATYQFGLSVPLAFGLMLALDETPIHSGSFSISVLLVTILLCITTAALGFLLVFGFGKLGMATGTAVLSLQVVFVVILAAFQGEHIALDQAFGLMLLVCAGCMSFVEESLLRHRQRASLSGVPEVL